MRDRDGVAVSRALARQSRVPQKVGRRSRVCAEGWSGRRAYGMVRRQRAGRVPFESSAGAGWAPGERAEAVTASTHSRICGKILVGLRRTLSSAEYDSIGITRVRELRRECVSPCRLASSWLAAEPADTSVCPVLAHLSKEEL